MKILFYIHALAGGGAERVCNTLANEFAKRGDEVFISCSLKRKVVYSFHEKVTLLDHSEDTRNIGFWSRFVVFRFFKMLRNMRRFAKEIRPDYAIGVMTDFSLFSIVALAGLGIPVVATEHTTVGRMDKRYKLLYRLLYPFASSVTVLTRHDLMEWKPRFRNVVCMPNPLTLSDTNKTYNRNKWVLGVGRVGAPEKGFDSMVKCWNLVGKNHPDWKLVIAGKCEDKDKEYLCGFLDDELASQIEFLGFRTDVYDLMLQSEVFLLSSRYEGLPMGLMEAMSAGCCCVAFDVVTGPRDIIQNGKSGILVENQNIQELAKSLDAVISNDELRLSLASEAPNSIKRFESGRILSRWDILFRLIEKNKKKA